MEQLEPTSTQPEYRFTPGVSPAARPEPELIDLTAIRAESQANDQAGTVMNHNQAGAEAILESSLWEYALLQGNERDDDATEVTQSASDAAAALQFIYLFRESFAAFQRSAEYNRLQLGEQAKWRPTLRDANGRVVGELNHVLLNPILPNVGQRPVVQFILPNRDYLAQVASRLRPDQQQAVQSGQPISYLERRPSSHADATVQTLMELMTPAGVDQRERVKRAMQEYRQSLETTKPEDGAGLRQAFGQMVQQTLAVEGVRREALIEKMMEVNPIYRVTYHPDIDVLGRQPIHLQTVPLDYKGVRLQLPQLKNLLLGNTIEVVGIRDERRPGLYRAEVRFNVLSGKMEGGSQREEIRTENKAEYRQHQQLVHRKGTDVAPHQTNQGQVAQPSDTAHQPVPKQRPAFRLGR